MDMETALLPQLELFYIIRTKELIRKKLYQKWNEVSSDLRTLTELMLPFAQYKKGSILVSRVTDNSKFPYGSLWKVQRVKFIYPGESDFRPIYEYEAKKITHYDHEGKELITGGYDTTLEYEDIPHFMEASTSDISEAKKTLKKFRQPKPKI